MLQLQYSATKVTGLQDSFWWDPRWDHPVCSYMLCLILGFVSYIWTLVFLQPPSRAAQEGSPSHPAAPSFNCLWVPTVPSAGQQVSCSHLSWRQVIHQAPGKESHPLPWGQDGQLQLQAAWSLTCHQLRGLASLRHTGPAIQLAWAGHMGLDGDELCLSA